MIHNLFYQLVTNMGKYLSQRERPQNNSCLTALFILADLSLFVKYFPHINHLPMK